MAEVTTTAAGGQLSEDYSLVTDKGKGGAPRSNTNRHAIV